MGIKIQSGSVSAKSPVDVLVIALEEGSVDKDALVLELDKAANGGMLKAIHADDWTGKKDAQLSLSTLGTIHARKVLFLGLGNARSRTLSDLRNAAVRAARFAQTEKVSSLAFAVQVAVDADGARAIGEGLVLGAYRFTKYLTGDRAPKKALEDVTVGFLGAGKGKNAKDFSAPLALGAQIGDAVSLTRDLVNEPPNELYPETLAGAAEAMCKKHKIKCTVLDHKEIVARGMKLIDAVGRGSEHGPRFVHMVYEPPRGKKAKKRIVLVGKGLTFDSGGLCIKQAQGMGDMKCDMAGAAVSIGAMMAIAAIKPDAEIHGIFAAAENMPDGDAYRPGDIFGSLEGKTVEIINTDAEGRLVLADALTYAHRLKPDVIIDHATLTGACMIALGAQTAGFYATDDGIAEAYLDAARKAGESMWRMPLLEDLRDSLKSDVADMKHTGDRYGGSISAALFLREFTGGVKWCHLDIAGPAFTERPTSVSPKGGTGFGVLSFVHFIEKLAAE